MKVEFHIKGLSALLMHADDVEQSDNLSDWRKSPDNKNLSKPGDDRSPGWTWMTYLYRDDGHISFPYANLMVCLRQAAAQVIVKKNKTFKELSQSGLIPAAENATFLVNGARLSSAKVNAIRDKSFSEQAKAVKEMGFELFVKRAKIGMAKHIRVRPRFNRWEIIGELEVILPELNREVIETIFEIAGNVGLGDWRPGCKTPGPFGRFVAQLKFSK